MMRTRSRSDKEKQQIIPGHSSSGAVGGGGGGMMSGLHSSGAAMGGPSGITVVSYTHTTADRLCVVGVVSCVVGVACIV